MSWSTLNSGCSIDSEALDYIPDYDIETEHNCESNEWIPLCSLHSCQTSQNQRQILLEWGESFITFPIS